MEDGNTPRDVSEAELARDLAELRPQALRQKYAKEARCHANTKQRCKNGDFELDPAWESFRDFLRDMGVCTSGDASLDRIDPEIRRYGPGLVRWATKKEQTVNRRNTRWIDFRGERLTLQAFADKLKLPYSTIHSALARHDTPEQIARRAEQPAPGSGQYRPLRITDPEKLDEWRSKYEAWCRGVWRDRRSSAPPEVYEAIIVSYALHRAEKRLETGGYYELTPDEVVQEADRWSDERRIVANAVDWIDHALMTLASKDLRLANSLRPSPGRSYRDIWQFDKWLTAQNEPE